MRGGIIIAAIVFSIGGASAQTTIWRNSNGGTIGTSRNMGGVQVYTDSHGRLMGTSQQYNGGTTIYNGPNGRGLGSSQQMGR